MSRDELDRRRDQKQSVQTTEQEWFVVTTQAKPGESYPGYQSGGSVMPCVYTRTRPYQFGDATLTRKDSSRYDLVYGYWNPEGTTLRCIRIGNRLFAVNKPVATSCGFSSQYSTWTSSETIAGNLTFTHSGTNVILSGSGVAVLRGTATISGQIGSGQAWGMTVRGPVQHYADIPSEGRFWLGIPGDIGICYSYADGEVQEVTLNADGTIASVTHTAAWTRDDFASLTLGGVGRPEIRLGWERFSSGDRYTIGPSTFTAIARAHVSRAMETTDFPVVIGADFSSVPESISAVSQITGEIGCGLPIADCRLCPDMPSPGIARVTGSWALTGYSGARGTPDFTGLNDPLLIYGDELRPAYPRQEGADGIWWNSACEWGGPLIVPNPALSPITFTPGTVLQSGWIVNEGMAAYMAKNLNWPYFVGCSAGGSPPDGAFAWGGFDPAKYQLAIHYSIAYGPSGTPQNNLTWVVHSAMYQANSGVDCLGTTTFTKLGETWSAPIVAGIPASTCQAPWVTGFPGSLTVEFP